jgi:hypothetical protein
MVIGFDFDKVFIDFPPFIPYSFIDYLYKGSPNTLHYRFPGKLEQKIRIFSHYPPFRHPLRNNINALKNIVNEKKYTTYLVSSRFGFLKKRTEAILNKYKLNQYFDGIFFNYEDRQPHVFKEETIRRLKIDTYIDDDIDLALYLAKKIPSLRIFWVRDGREKVGPLPANIIAIKDLSDLTNYLHKK